MKRRRTAIIAALVLGFGVPVAPAIAAPAPAAASAHTAVRVPSAFVNYPKAVPGRFCKKEHRRDWTTTKKYGQVKCIEKNGWRWVRSG